MPSKATHHKEDVMNRESAVAQAKHATLQPDIAFWTDSGSLA